MYSLVTMDVLVVRSVIVNICMIDNMCDLDLCDCEYMIENMRNYGFV
jgi:uncharacterized protein YkvS